MPLVALVLSIVAVLLSATIWLSFAGAPLGVVSLLLGLLALRAARRRGERSRAAIAAVVLSLVAIAALPVLLAVCNGGGVSCV